MSVAKCRRSWVLGRSHGSWVLGRSGGSWVNVEDKNKNK